MKSNLCRLNVIFAETIYYNFNVSHAKKRPTAAFLLAACSICLSIMKLSLAFPGPISGDERREVFRENECNANDN